MKISAAFALAVLLKPTVTVAFAPSSIDGRRSSASTTTTQLSVEPSHSSSSQQWIGKAVTMAAVTVSLWATPSIVAEQMPQWLIYNNNNPFVALAVEKASGTGSRVNKDADSLLRLALPINNKEVRHTITFGGTGGIVGTIEHDSRV
jgi:hypothetical protein